MNRVTDTKGFVVPAIALLLVLVACSEDIVDPPVYDLPPEAEVLQDLLCRIFQVPSD